MSGRVPADGSDRTPARADARAGDGDGVISFFIDGVCVVMM